MRLTSLQLSALTMAALACASGCADDGRDRGESGALATIDDPSGAEAGDAGSLAGELTDGSIGITPTLDGGEAIDGGGAVARDGGLDAGSSVTVPHPSGSYFASIIANGTGCPAGTWKTELAPDGQSSKLVFSAYEVSIDDRVADRTVTRNCTLSIKMHSPTGLSFAITSFTVGGYAFLEQGVTASVWARYQFQGNPVAPTNRNRVNLVGPYDADFVFRGDVETADVVWSPCGVDRELIINTTLQLQNGTPKRSGYINITELPTPGAITLRWRACNGAPPAPEILPRVR